MRIVVVGSGGVGKSCCTSQYLKNKFYEDYDPTIEESYQKEMMVDDRKVMLEVLDTAGQDEFRMFREATLQYGEGFLVVYAIDDQASWREAQRLHKQVGRLKDEPWTPSVIVGNKLDLEDKRQVKTEEAAEYCRQNNITHMECSAKENANVKEAFEHLVREIWRHRTTTPADNTKCCAVS